MGTKQISKTSLEEQGGARILAGGNAPVCPPVATGLTVAR